MRTTRATIVALTRAFGLSLTEGEVEELNARLMLDEPLISMLESFDNVSMLPALKLPWGLPGDSILASAPHSLTERADPWLQ